MIKLSIEQKAKAYDGALERAKEQSSKYCLDKIVLEDIFPELKDSEDEQIRKAVIDAVETLSDSPLKVKMLAWLEKQGEQKPANWFQELEDKLANATPQQLAEWKEKYFKKEPAEWSEEDEAVLDALIRRLEGEDVYVSPHLAAEHLKSIKDRVQPQPKQEWSEEDDEMLNLITARLHSHPNIDLEEYSKEYDWLNYRLKYLRPQNHWKPSDEQMKALESIFAKHGAYNDDLLSLISDLKKLREE